MPSLSALQTSRSVLVTALDNLSDHQLTASIDGKSTPIGEILLHIAAVEFLITGVLAKSDNASIDTAIWRDLKPGFARELDLPSERQAFEKRRIEQAMVGVRTVSTPIVPSAKKVSIDDMDDFLSTLPSSGAAEREKIKAALVETCEVHGGLAAPPWVIILSHESYHRGQILLLRHQVGQ